MSIPAIVWEQRGWDMKKLALRELVRTHGPRLRPGREAQIEHRGHSFLLRRKDEISWEVTVSRSLYEVQVMGATRSQHKVVPV